MTNFIKTAKKVIISLALAGVAVFAAFASACTIETNHPKAEIVLEIGTGEDVKSVKLRYTLYRNIRPVTVKHFIELADKGFYDNTVIHNYTTSDWYAGGYGYDEDGYSSAYESETLRNYLDDNCKESAYYELSKELTPSVYKNHIYIDGKESVSGDDVLPYLMGEFSNNINQEIGNDVCVDGFGCLKMYYYGKKTTGKVYVTPTKDQIIQADYTKNCATSLFMMQVSNTSAYKASNYSVFALLDNTDDLTKFLDEVDDMLDGLENAQVTVNVDNLEAFSKDEADRNIETSFTVPALPLVVKSVKITKY